MAWLVYWRGEEGSGVKEYFGECDAPGLASGEKPKRYESKKAAQAALEKRANEAFSPVAEYAIEHVDEWIVKWKGPTAQSYFSGDALGTFDQAWKRKQKNAKRYATKEEARADIQRRVDLGECSFHHVKFVRLVGKKR